MDYRHFIAILASSLSISLVQAQTTDQNSQRQRLIEQKTRLVESLVNSPATQSAVFGREMVLENGRSLLAQARTALTANRLDEANAALDDALRLVSKSSSRQAARNDTLEVQQSRFRSLNEQVDTYLIAIEDIAKQNGEAKGIAARIHTMRTDAKKLADTGRMGDANRQLAESYTLAVESISRLRAGQTVTLSLKFDTPADEYAYEIKRFQSGEILVNMMLDEGRANGERRNTVDERLGTGRQQKETAAKQAESGDYRAAITSMEKATAELNRALQMMGIPVF